MQRTIFYFCSIFLFAAVIKPSCGAVARTKPVEKPAEFADQEGCYSPETNSVIPFNEKLTASANTLGVCGEFLCKEDGSFIIYTCGSIAAGPGFKVVDGDMTASHPACCPTIVSCKEDQHSATC